MTKKYRLNIISSEKSLNPHHETAITKIPREGEESIFWGCHIILFKISNFQQKIVRHAEEQGSIAHTQEKNQSIETVSGEPQMLDSFEKDFK